MAIPQKVTVKLLQPFFSTRPTNRRTGLCPSLWYEIINAYGRELFAGLPSEQAETKEGASAEFVIQLPFA